MFSLGNLGLWTGVFGLVFYLLAGVISARIPGLDARFGGLTRLWKIHHLLGAGAFLLLMAHPLLLAFAADSPRAASAVLFPGWGSWSIWAGWAALAAMTAFLAPTFEFFGPVNYQRWKLIHALSGLALILGAAHAYFLCRALPGGVWLGGAALALASFIYRMLLARFVGTKRYTIVRADAIGHGVVELSLKPDGDVLKYFSGQFVYLTPLDPGLAAGRGEEHPYTVSSAPREPVLRVAIKNLGDASRALQTAAVGGAVLIEGPYGGLFPAEARPMRELWIAGGIGITPFLSRARSLEAARPVDVLLVYCVQDVSRAHFLGELESVAAHIPGFRFRPHYFYREGSLTAAFLRAHCPDFVEREIFVCGPAPLIVAARGELLREGVPAARLHSEDFTWL